MKLIGILSLQTAQIGGSTFTFTSTRDQVIDYTTPLFEEANGILARRPVVEDTMWSVFQPLTWVSWSSIAGAVIISAFFSWLFSRFSPISAWNLGVPFAIKDEVWMKEHLWSVCGSLLQQGQWVGFGQSQKLLYMSQVKLMNKISFLVETFENRSFFF